MVYLKHDLTPQGVCRLAHSALDTSEHVSKYGVSMSVAQPVEEVGYSIH